MNIHNELGYGFLEKVYENALMIALQEKEIKVSNQQAIQSTFTGNGSEITLQI